MEQPSEERPSSNEVKRRAKALELTIDYLQALGSNLKQVADLEWNTNQESRESPLGTPASIPRIADTFHRYLWRGSDSAEE